MKETTEIIIGFVIIAISFLVIGIVIGDHVGSERTTERLNVSNELCRQAGLDITDEQILGGFFTSSDIYCVRTDMNWFRDQQFKKHEKCHALVKHDYQHFCEEAVR